ncbi:MAG TPA: hypothetical protein VGH93_02970, partial [Solirubrobacteraceae bacterium]
MQRLKPGDRRREERDGIATVTPGAGPQNAARASARASNTTASGRRGVLIAIVALNYTVSIAACGSAGPTNSSLAGQGKYAESLAFATCMRSHGVPNFPDPTRSGGSIQILGSAPGINRQSPGFKYAQQSCRHLLPGGGQPSQAEQQ